VPVVVVVLLLLLLVVQAQLAAQVQACPAQSLLLTMRYHRC
jgi:hypothetical protein